MSFLFFSLIKPPLYFVASNSCRYSLRWRLTCVEACRINTHTHRHVVHRPINGSIVVQPGQMIYSTVSVPAPEPEPGHRCRSLLESWGGISADAREMRSAIQTITSTQAQRCRRGRHKEWKERGRRWGRSQVGSMGVIESPTGFINGRSVCVVSWQALYDVFGPPCMFSCFIEYKCKQHIPPPRPTSPFQFNQIHTSLNMPDCFYSLTQLGTIENA